MSEFELGEVASTSSVGEGNESSETVSPVQETSTYSESGAEETNDSFESSETSETETAYGEDENSEGPLFSENEKSYDELRPQEVAEQAHDRTKESMISEHGDYMSQEQLSMLESEDTKERLTVMSSEEYTETFSNVDVNVLGHCDSEGNIYMKDISPEITDHVSTHETMHLCANREIIVNEDGSKTIRSGLRESTVYENGGYTDSGMGVNEGATEMYTLRELRNRGEDDAVYSITSYPEARMWSERMEKVVGEDKMAEAYFGGRREELKEEFNRLNGNDPDAWDNYKRDIDTIQFGHDPELIGEANARINAQFRVMVKNKYGI